MPRSIKSLVVLSFVIIGLSLLLVIVIGVRQYRLNTRYAEISSLSERALFGFGTIRDQVTEALIGGDPAGLSAVIPGIEQLNGQISKLYDYPMIPAQYKLAMANSVDLSTLVIGLRKLEAAGADGGAGLDLQRELRQIGENLIRIDRIISGHIRDSVIGFQLSVIGIMGVLISAASFVLISLYRRGVKPLLDLAGGIAAGNAPDTLDCPPEAGAEIVALVASLNRVLAGREAAAESSDRAGDSLELLSQTVNETANGLNAVINYAELLRETGARSLSAEQREMLEKIIESGERIGRRWQQISRQFDR